MDFGVGFLSNNVMVPILDFFYGIVPSYGLAIIFLTLVVRLALFPLNAGSIRNMRKMKIVQPIMQQKLKEAQERYANDPEKLREVQSELYKEFGNPLAGCLPLVVQMPLLFALFATLRGSPFADVPVELNLQVLSSDVAAEIVPAPFVSGSKNIFLNENQHRPIVLTSSVGQRLAAGQQVQLQLQSETGRSWSDLLSEFANDPAELAVRWQVTKGEDRVQIAEDGTLTALEPGDVTVQAIVPGLAAHSGFLFIKELGHVGAFDPDGTLHWDVIALVLVFGLSTYVSQTLSQGGAAKSSDPKANAQSSVNKITPILFSGMFLFFPLPAGVLMYIVVSNLVQVGQTFILSREPLPVEIQTLVDAEQKRQGKASGDGAKPGRDALPFER